MISYTVNTVQQRAVGMELDLQARVVSCAVALIGDMDDLPDHGTDMRGRIPRDVKPIRPRLFENRMPLLALWSEEVFHDTIALEIITWSEFRGLSSQRLTRLMHQTMVNDGHGIVNGLMEASDIMNKDVRRRYDYSTLGGASWC